LKLLTKLGIVLIVIGIVHFFFVSQFLDTSQPLQKQLVDSFWHILVIFFGVGIVLLIISAIKRRKSVNQSNHKISDEIQELKDKVEELEKDKEKKE